MGLSLPWNRKQSDTLGIFGRSYAVDSVDIVARSEDEAPGHVSSFPSLEDFQLIQSRARDMLYP